MKGFPFNLFAGLLAFSYHEARFYSEPIHHFEESFQLPFFLLLGEGVTHLNGLLGPAGRSNKEVTLILILPVKDLVLLVEKVKKNHIFVKPTQIFRKPQGNCISQARIDRIDFSRVDLLFF